MRKFLRIAICGVAMFGLACICGCNSGKITISAQELGNRLLNEINYVDELNEIPMENADMIFSFGDANVSEASIYEGNGGTAEEIVVVKCAASEDVSKVKAGLETRIEEQKECFKDYVPEEMEKLNNAVLITNGDYVILSVSDEPDKAKTIINNAGK